MKKTLILLLLPLFTFAQKYENEQESIRRANETQLLIFERALPFKNYSFDNSDLQVKWQVIIFDLLEQTYGYSPNVAARSLAYINLAAYEAILPAYPNQRSLSDQIQGYTKDEVYNLDAEGFIPQVALNNAMYRIVDQLFQTAPYVYMEKVLAFRDEVNIYYRKKSDAANFITSKNYGESIADLIYDYSKSDGGHMSYLRSFDMQYRSPKCDACFTINRVADLENTGPLHPNWGNNRTFVAENEGDFGIVPKVVFSSEKDSPFYKMAMEVYDTSKEVTPDSEKHKIANFWDDAAGFTYTAPGHSIAILTQVLRRNPKALNEGAELFCMVGLAINDGVIAAFEAKYKHNLIRPIAYIHNYIDPEWQPTLLTPPFPEFPSGHSVQSAAAAQVLTDKLGDKVSYTDYSKYWVGQPRFYNNFWHAADEVSISRLYGGIHYIDALDQGQDMGRLVGNNILKLQFKK